MEELEHSLFIVELINKLLSKPLSSLLALLGIEVAHPEHLIPDYVVMSLIAAGLLMLFFSLSSKKPQLIPSRIQSVMELIIQFFEGLLSDLIGKDGKKYLPLVGTVGLFILACNLMGLVPGFMSPTSKLNVTAGCALTVFIYYHWQGIKSQGLFKYMKHFMGPIPLLAPLMVPIEIISHFSRPLSLSMRLFGNIFAEELLILIMASIIPFLLPLPFMAIAIITAVVQAYVFVLLSCIYIAGAVAHEEEHQ
jgi:F-type H+-transporting ATPase subunit a